MSIDRTYTDRSAVAASGASLEEGYAYKQFEWMRTAYDVQYVLRLLHERNVHDALYRAFCASFFRRAERLGHHSIVVTYLRMERRPNQTPVQTRSQAVSERQASIQSHGWLWRLLHFEVTHGAGLRHG